MATRLGEFEIGIELPLSGPERRFRAFSGRRHGVLGFSRDVTIFVSTDADVAEEQAVIERARSGVSLSHAGVLRVLGTGRGTIDGAERTYVVYERSDAPALSELLTRAPSVPLAVAFTIAAAVADVLDHAHRRGVAHGRLGADRILIGREGSVRLDAFALERKGSPGEDLAALGRVLRDLSGGDEHGLRAAERLEGGEPGSAGDASELFTALAFEKGPAPGERSIAAWVASTAHASPAKKGRGAVVRLEGEPAALESALSELERSGAHVDRRASIAVFTESGVPDLETAITLARAVTAEGAVSAAVVSVALDAAPAEAFSDELSNVPRGQVWVSAEVAEEARASFVFSGVAEAAAVFAAAGERAVATAGRFVGRRAELWQLAESLREATDRGPIRVSVTGPLGIGKSRLVAELVRRARRGGARTHLVRLSLVPRTPLAGATAVVRELGDDRAEVTVAGLARVFEAAARDAPCVVCLDDIHLTDRESRELVDAAFAAVTPGTRLLLVDSARGEGAQSGALLALGELSDDEVAELVAARLGARVVPPELFESVVERTGGHPLYIEEALRELVSRALVDVEKGVAKLRAGADVRLPTSLEALVKMRLATLEPVQRRVLAAASIAEPGTLPGAIAEMAGLPPDSASEIVWQLDSGGFARLDDAGGLHVASVHRDAVLELVSAEDVAGLHRSAARVLAHETTPSALTARAAHLEQIGELGDASRARLAAARAFTAASAWAEAAGELVGALRGLETFAEIDPVLAELVRIKQATGMRVDIEPVLERVASTLEAEPIAPADLARARLAMAQLLPNATESAWVLLDAAEAAHADENDAEVARARVSVARAAAAPGRAIEAARRLAEDSAVDAGTLADAATVAVLAGDEALARALLERAATESPEALRLRGELFVLAGDFEAAERELCRASERARQIDDLEEHARARLALGDLHRDRDGARSFAAFSEAARAAREAGARELAELAAMYIDALSAKVDAPSRESLERRRRSAEARGFGWGALVGAALSAELSGDAERTTKAADEADSLGFGALARRLRERGRT